MTAVDKPMTIRFRDAGDQLQELLDTRPSEPTVEELKRWWDSTVRMLPGVLDEFGEQRKAVRQLRDDLDGARAALRREQDARAQLRVELDRTKAERDEAQMLCRDARIQAMDRGASYQASQAELAELRLVAAVSLTPEEVVALDEFREDCVDDDRDEAPWPSHVVLTAIEKVLGSPAERVSPAAEPCCPSSTLPGSPHDVGCRGGGKVH